MRIVSVLPSATEIVCALGARDELVGRSAECDYPEAVRDVPVVMRARTLDSDRPSADIDARVKAARARGESLYELDVDRLRYARPDVLLTQDLCGVCSVTGEEVAAACRQAGIRPKIVSLLPHDLDEVWATFETVGEAIGRASAGRELAQRSRRAVGKVTMSRGPRVAVVEWLDPPILAGLWTPDLVVAAGGTPVGPRSGEVGERTSWEQLSAREPDLVLLSPCSFSVEHTLRELSDPALSRQVAAGQGRAGTFVADEAFFSRPGPRLVEGVALLRALVEGRPYEGPMPYRRWGRPRTEVAA